MAGCPWNSAHRLVRVGLKAREIAHAVRPACNLVFLVDVSGSMRPENKLPLLRQGLLMLTDRLRGDDTVGIVTYAGGAGVALQPTSGDDRQQIRDALTAMQAGGSTHGSAGIRRAYELAREHFREEGVNRVILCTDGDFNVGVTSQSDLTRLIETEAKSGIFLTVLGFGVGNYKDTTMEALADRGNGQYAYIDNLNEAHKVLVNEMTSTLVTVAKDVKLQVEFNPAKVQAYRLIGYENRLLRAEDFNDDRKDAGEIGAGHSVTALYEIVPPGVAYVSPRVDPLKYQQPAAPAPAFEATRQVVGNSPEMLTAKLRWKAPEADTSERREFTLVDVGKRYGQASADFKFAAAVAAFGMILVDSPNRGTTSLDAVLELAGEGLGSDRDGYRADFLEMVRRTKALPWFQRREASAEPGREIRNSQP